MAKRLTAAERKSFSDFHAEHPACWLCLFLGIKPGKTELHHIAYRGRSNNVRENYAALCKRHHVAIQGRTDSELISLVLKRLYDNEHYSPETICRLRGRAATCWTDGDVELTHRIMDMMKECCR